MKNMYALLFVLFCGQLDAMVPKLHSSHDEVIRYSRDTLLELNKNQQNNSSEKDKAMNRLSTLFWHQHAAFVALVHHCQKNTPINDQASLDILQVFELYDQQSKKVADHIPALVQSHVHSEDGNMCLELSPKKETQ